MVEHGTGTAAWLSGRPVAGKTGTAARATDAWFCGYVPQLATCVWVGYPGAARPMRNVEGYPEVYGGTIPALIWHDFMAAATAEMPVEAFAPGSYELYADPPPASASPAEPVVAGPHDIARAVRASRSVALARAGAVDGAFAEAVAEAVEVAATAVPVPVVRPGRRGRMTATGRATP